MSPERHMLGENANDSPTQKARPDEDDLAAGRFPSRRRGSGGESVRDHDELTSLECDVLSIGYEVGQDMSKVKFADYEADVSN